MHDRTRDQSADVGGRRGGLLQTLLAAMVASAFTGGSAVAVLRASMSDHERRLQLVEEHDRQNTTAIAGLVKDVEWLVRQSGGTPAPKGP